MQEFRSMPQGGGGRFFGDRRLRPFPNQALKCPRCDSLNTKFCYYNNYNLSQPRHFCKSCRRYWTKGGVLRNVPVGGGCRKAKRSKHKSSSEKERRSSNNSHSSSESSSLTATTTTTTVNNEAAAAATTITSSSSDVPSLINFSDSRLFMNQQPTTTQAAANFEMLENLENQSSGIFAENGSFTSLMNVGNPFNFSDISTYRYNGNQQQEMELQQQQEKQMASMVEEMKMQELTAGCIDQNRTSNGELTALDWQSNGDQGLFDLANNVDQGGYWSQNQWNENDQHLYLP